MVRIEQVNPCEFADAGSRILEESWPAPHVRYSPQYLRWQFGYPGPLPGLGVAAFEGDEAVGFAGATPRRVRFRGRREDVYVVSFVAVRPAWQKQGIAAALYAELLRLIRQAEAVVVTFAQRQSAGQRRLLAAYEAAAFHVRPLGEYPIYGYVAPPDVSPPANVQWSEQIDRLLPLIRAVNDGRIIRHDPDEAVMSHLAADPRPRRAVIVQAADGATMGAMVVRHEIVGRGGIEGALLLDNLCLPHPRLDLLRHLCLAIASRAQRELVTASNLSGIDPPLLRAAGLRQTRSVFAGYVCAPDAAHPFLQADAVDLEVV